MTTQTLHEPETGDWVFVTIAKDGSTELTPCAGLACAEEALASGMAKVAVFYMSPTTALARRLATGDTAASALERWRLACMALLDLYRRNRSRMSLFEMPAGEAPDDATRAALNEAMGVATWPAEALAPERTKAFEPLAALVLESGAGARDLIDQLQAATASGFEELAPGPALLESALVAQHAANAQAKQNGAGQQARLDETAALIEVLAGQVGALETSLRQSETGRREDAAAQQAQLNNAETQRARLAQQVNDLRESLRQSEATARETTVDLKDQLDKAKMALECQYNAQKKANAEERARFERLSQSSAVLQRQVGELQEALTQSDTDRSRDKAEKLRLDAAWRRQVTDLVAALDAMKGSTSWRMTGLMRSVVCRFRR